MVVPEQEGERHRVGGEGASGEERVIVEQVDKCRSSGYSTESTDGNCWTRFYYR